MSKPIAWGVVALLCASLTVFYPLFSYSDDTPQDRPNSGLPLSPSEAILDGCFATSGACAMCHSSSENATAMRSPTGKSLAPFDLWQATMMANSARDPLWRAVVSAEVAATPSRKSEIEAKCLRCHAPMAAVESEHQSVTLDMSVLYDPESRYHQLALDGVSCTACHQITPEGLGEKSSFSGHYKIEPGRAIYGPHDDVFPMPMIRHTGFTPTYGAHIEKSELCATCHTLHTTGFEADGTSTGIPFLEQAPYLEWKASDFSRGDSPQSCQSCHVPKTSDDGTPLSTAIARNPGGFDFPFLEARSPYGQHRFVGGNTLIPAILRDHADELRPQAPREAFDAVIAQTREQLTQRTIDLGIVDVERKAGSLSFGVRVKNRAGHKFPSGHPTRRAWLHVRVVAEDGTALFESGRYDAAGRIVNSSGKIDPADLAGGPQRPHYATIRSPEQVQVFEGIMADSKSQPTYTLLRATHWQKDNRLLPKGWRDSEETQPIAVLDDDFSAGSDTVRYVIDSAKADSIRAARIEVELVYQVLGARYAAELFRYDTPQIRDFRRYYEKADRTPERVASAHAKVPDAKKRTRF